MIYDREYLPMFSSKSFIVSGLTFRSLIHFEFIFVYGVRKCSSFILFFFLRLVIGEFIDLGTLVWGTGFNLVTTAPEDGANLWLGWLLQPR